LASQVEVLATVEEGKNHLIARFAHLYHMIGKVSVFLALLYIKLFELGVRVTFHNRSTVARNKGDLLKFSEQLL